MSEGSARSPERREGLLHPRAYLWVIGTQFSGYYDFAPRGLLENYHRSCRLWNSYPHRGLAVWELRRFRSDIIRLLGDDNVDSVDYAERIGVVHERED